MKRWIFTALVLPFLFAACGGNNDNNSGGTTGTIATVPPPTNTCMNGTTYCNSNMYGQNFGYAAYPYNPYFYGVNYGFYNASYYGSFCDCPPGHRPVYNTQYGLGCVSVSSFQPYAYGAVYWGWGANNNQWVNVPQVSNTQGYPSSNTCYRNVVQTCFVDQVNSCGASATCQATGGGSRLGVCVTAGGSAPGAGGASGYR